MTLHCIITELQSYFKNESKNLTTDFLCIYTIKADSSYHPFHAIVAFYASYIIIVTSKNKYFLLKQWVNAALGSFLYHEATTSLGETSSSAFYTHTTYIHNWSL